MDTLGSAMTGQAHKTSFILKRTFALSNTSRAQRFPHLFTLTMTLCATEGTMSLASAAADRVNSSASQEDAGEVQGNSREAEEVGRGRGCEGDDQDSLPAQAATVGFIACGFLFAENLFGVNEREGGRGGRLPGKAG